MNKNHFITRLTFTTFLLSPLVFFGCQSGGNYSNNPAPNTGHYKHYQGPAGAPSKTSTGKGMYKHMDQTNSSAASTQRVKNTRSSTNRTFGTSESSYNTKTHHSQGAAPTQVPATGMMVPNVE